MHLHTRHKTKTRFPRSKSTMSPFPNILHHSTRSTGDRLKTTPTPSRTDHGTEHQHVNQVDLHRISEFLISFLSHMFTPVAYQQCTSSAPCWVVSHHSECLSEKSNKATIVVDDEFVLLDDKRNEERDGGPICREATIESWKAPNKRPSRYGAPKRWTDLPYFGCP